VSPIGPIVTGRADTAVETPHVVSATRPVQAAEPDHTGRGPPIVALLLPEMTRKKRDLHNTMVSPPVEETATTNRVYPTLAQSHDPHCPYARSRGPAARIQSQDLEPLAGFADQHETTV
jgi:hypothetical protein